MRSAGYGAVLLKSDPEQPDDRPREVRSDEVDLPLLDTMADYELRVSWGPLDGVNQRDRLRGLVVVGGGD